METLFGPDGVGGEPGAAGKFLDFAMGADINPNAPEPQNGQEMLAKYGKDLARLPFTIAKLPLDFLSDPAMFLREGGRGADIGAILSPTYRKEKKERLKAEEGMEKARLAFSGLKMADDFIASLGLTPEAQRYDAVEKARQAGVPDDVIEQGLAAASTYDQQSRAAQEAVLAEDPTLPTELVAGIAPDKALATIIGLRKAKDVQSRADFRAKLAQAREARLAAQPPPESAAQRFGRKQKERGATKVYDQTADATTESVNSSGLIDSISDPGIRGSLRENLPAFSARQAEKAANKFADEALPPTSRKNIFQRKQARAAIKEAIKEVSVGLDSPILDESPLPTEPAKRVAMAEDLGVKLLAAGFPPDRAAAELLRRGFKPEELPE